MNNQECKTRREISNINCNEPSFYPYNILVNKCSGSCNNINDLYAKLCIPDVDKNMNIKVFKELMKQDIYLGMKLVNVNVDQIQVLVVINNVGIMINVDVNAKN